MTLFHRSRAFARTVAVGVLAAAIAIAPVSATQDPLWSPTSGTVSGLNLTNNYNAALSALASCNSGGSAPTNVLGGSPPQGQCWLDTSTTPPTVRMFDGVSTWVPVARLDSTNHFWVPPVGGGTNSLSSASTTDLWSVGQASITITGSVTITQLANASAIPGTLKFVKFAASLQLTYDATKLILPGLANITTVAGDTAVVLALSSTNSQIVSYTRADGSSVAQSTFGRSYLAGLILSNDGSLPNTVLDIAAGVATDSTNAYLIQLGAFTKAVSGAWVAGSGANGMGQGLTATLNTWYHICLARNGGTPDVFFDTSATCANRPSSITDTAYRRIGSMRLDGSVHILAFTQVGDEFHWAANTVDLSYANNNLPGGGTAQTVTLTVPTGVQVEALFHAIFASNGSGAASLLITSFDENDIAPDSIGGSGNGSLYAGFVNALIQGDFRKRTNTSGQVRYRAASNYGGAGFYTFGWVDRRGRDN